MIPFFGCKQEYADDVWEYQRITNEVLSTGQWLQGDPIRQLEETLGTKYSRHCVAVNSCTDALFFALKALGIGPGDEVLVPTFSFVATASCILRAGATPVFVSVNEDTGLIDIAQAMSLVSDKTKAMIFVHLYGNMVSYEDIQYFRNAHPEVALIEDAAQALGSYLMLESGDYVYAGQIGDISCFSFDPTKTVPAPGSGGALLTEDEDLAAKCRSLRYHGAAEGVFYGLGYNSQMSSLTAAILNYKLTKQPIWDATRHGIARQYKREIDACFMRMTHGCVSNYHKFVIVVHRRWAFMEEMRLCGVETKAHYHYSLDQLPAFGGEPIGGRYLPDHVVSLPIYPQLTTTEVGIIIDRTNETLLKLQ